MINRYIHIHHDLDRPTGAPLSLDDQALKSELDKLFKPLDKSILKYLPKTGDLSPEATKSLLQNEPSMKV